MKQYYSQSGEDFLLWSLFDKKSGPGVFIEVGALDGIRFSNTYSFEREGWKGVCVEPHPDYFPFLKANRPGSVCVQAAASKEKGQIEFYAEPRGEFSTTVRENVENEVLAKKMAGYKKVVASTLPLDFVLENAGISAPIDIVSIDVEGAELDVLAGFSLSVYQPYVLIIEANNEVANAQIDGYMHRNGYYKAGRLGRSNNFYCRSFFGAIKLAFKPIRCTVFVHELPVGVKANSTNEILLPSLIQQSWQSFFKRVVRRINNWWLIR